MMLLLLGYTFSFVYDSFITQYPVKLTGSYNLILEITGRNESREKETHLYSLSLVLN